MLHLEIFKNNEEIDLSISSTILVLDTDFIQLKISNEHNEKIEIYVEDFLLPLVYFEDKDILSSVSDKIFRESFGHSHLRVYKNDEFAFEIVFNVNTNKTKFDQIKSMVSYLLNNNDRILDICFSRTKAYMSNSGRSDASFEKILLAAETIINIFMTKKNILSTTLRSQLLPVKQDLNESNINNINPFDVVENISDLFVSNNPDAIKLKNKFYSLDYIKRENYFDNYNLIENQILLGGIVSIKIMLDEMQSLINKNNNLTFEKEYENLKSFQNNYSLEDLYLQLTTAGMELRIQNLLNSISIILFEIQKKLKVDFNGYIHPRITPFVKSSSFYMSIFKNLQEWYGLGSPNLGINQTLIKIRSISKIYEIFCLYKIIEIFVSHGWEVFKSIEHKFFKNFIPSFVEFRKENITLSLYYEKNIIPIDSNVQHNDLIYLIHHKKLDYHFYTPDFVLKIDDGADNVGYYILDAKYSSTSTLLRYDVLNELFRKYHTNLGVYDSRRSIVSSDKILSINALHPFGEKDLTKWHQSEFFRTIPDVSTVKVSGTENDLKKIIALIDYS